MTSWVVRRKKRVDTGQIGATRMEWEKQSKQRFERCLEDPRDPNKGTGQVGSTRNEWV